MALSSRAAGFRGLQTSTTASRRVTPSPPPPSTPPRPTPVVAHAKVRRWDVLPRARGRVRGANPRRRPHRRRVLPSARSPTPARCSTRAWCRAFLPGLRHPPGDRPRSASADGSPRSGVASSPTGSTRCPHGYLGAAHRPGPAPDPALDLADPVRVFERGEAPPARSPGLPHVRDGRPDLDDTRRLHTALVRLGADAEAKYYPRRAPRLPRARLPRGRPPPLARHLGFPQPPRLLTDFAKRDAPCPQCLVEANPDERPPLAQGSLEHQAATLDAASVQPPRTGLPLRRPAPRARPPTLRRRGQEVRRAPPTPRRLRPRAADPPRGSTASGVGSWPRAAAPTCAASACRDAVPEPDVTAPSPRRALTARAASACSTRSELDLERRRRLVDVAEIDEPLRPDRRDDRRPRRHRPLRLHAARKDFQRARPGGGVRHGGGVR